jgi:alkaline phosphatase
VSKANRKGSFVSVMPSHRMISILAITLFLFLNASLGSAEQISIPRYIFLFIGDGMGPNHVQAGEAFAASVPRNGETEPRPLVMTTLPVHGTATTYSQNNAITDSAAAATALSTGFKTSNGTISMNADHTSSLTTLAEKTHDKGLRVGILTSVTINHATPAGFYAHQPSRSNYYEIGQQLAASPYEFFGGGGVGEARGKKGDQPYIIDLARNNNFSIVVGRSAAGALGNGSDGAKAFVMDQGKMENELPYDMDRPTDQMPLSEFTHDAVAWLDNPKGFFAMVEGGKIDWASHSNDGAAMVREVLSFDDAVAEGMAFYKAHPSETLLVVTADHETGGLQLDTGKTKWKTNIANIALQKQSADAFSGRLTQFKNSHSGITDIDKLYDEFLPIVAECFGLISDDRPITNNGTDRIVTSSTSVSLDSEEVKAIRTALAVSMGLKTGLTDDRKNTLYGGKEPTIVTLTRILDNESGMTWTSYNHTATSVDVRAIGIGQEKFAGNLDNTDIPKMLMKVIEATKEESPSEAATVEYQ